MTQNNDTKRFFKKRNPENPYKQRIFEIYCWCERRDLNPYESPHTPLKRARLPIPPLSRRARLPIPPLSRLPQYYTTCGKKSQVFFQKNSTVFCLLFSALRTAAARAATIALRASSFLLPPPLRLPEGTAKYTA